MPEINLVAVVVAAAASFAASAAWYAVLGNAVARLQQQWRGAKSAQDAPVLVQMLAFFAAALVLAFVTACIVGLTDITGVVPAFGLGLLLWIGFCATQWVSSIVGENVPVQLAAIHAGDWLLHMLIITVIVGTWQ